MFRSSWSWVWRSSCIFSALLQLRLGTIHKRPLNHHVVIRPVFLKVTGWEWWCSWWIWTCGWVRPGNIQTTDIAQLKAENGKFSASELLSELQEIQSKWWKWLSPALSKSWLWCTWSTSSNGGEDIDGCGKKRSRRTSEDTVATIVSSNVGEDWGWRLGTSEDTVVVSSNIDEGWGWGLGTSDINELWYRYITYSKSEERASPSTEFEEEGLSRNSARMKKAIDNWLVDIFVELQTGGRRLCGGVGWCYIACRLPIYRRILVWSDTSSSIRWSENPIWTWRSQVFWSFVTNEAGVSYIFASLTLIFRSNIFHCFVPCTFTRKGPDQLILHFCKPNLDEEIQHAYHNTPVHPRTMLLMDNKSSIGIFRGHFPSLRHMSENCLTSWTSFFAKGAPNKLFILKLLTPSVDWYQKHPVLPPYATSPPPPFLPLTLLCLASCPIFWPRTDICASFLVIWHA